MRSTKELIAELDAEATQHMNVAMVVAFENTILPIFPADENRLMLLDNAVNVGGSPIGLIAFDRSTNGQTIATRVFPEYDAVEAEQASHASKHFLKK